MGKELQSVFDKLDVPMDDQRISNEKQYVKEMANHYIHLEKSSHMQEFCVCVTHGSSVRKENEIYENVNQAMIQAQDEVLDALNKANIYVLAALENATRKMVN